MYYGCELESFEMRLFNRWGEVIFETKDENFIWDGSLKNGNYVQEGVYTWQIRIFADYIRELEYEEFVGHVVVVR